MNVHDPSNFIQNPNQPNSHVMGIDIGGTGIKGAIVNVETGEMMTERIRLSTPQVSKPDAVALVVQTLVRKFDYCGPVGAGFPTVIRNGICYTAANIHKKWINFDVAEIFTRHTGCPFYIINDADAAGMAEIKFGAAKGFNGVILMITLGRGIGTSIYVNGTLLPNLEFGHLVIRGKDAEKRASDFARQEKKWSWKQWSARLQEYLTTMENLFWPDMIIIGGGVSKMHDQFFPFLETRAKIVPAQLLNQAGIIGAALYAFERHSFKAS
jgi:polyphosphate glucokinase